jgi:peptidyl-tRNA hydrolase, PTH2 family
MAATLSSSVSAMQPWLYFLSGALLPSIAYYFLWKRSEEQIEQLLNQNDSADDEDEESDIDDNHDGTTPAKAVNKTTDDDDDDNGPSSWGMAHAPYKMVLIVNQSLSMGKGKIAAQCSHAAVGCYKRARRVCPAALKAWEWTGCAKIAVKNQSTDPDVEFQEIATRAAAKGIPMHLVEDAGRTQIAAGSKTVLGLGPAPTFVFEGVSDHLKLL